MAKIINVSNHGANMGGRAGNSGMDAGGSGDRGIRNDAGERVRKANAHGRRGPEFGDRLPRGVSEP